MAKALFFYFGVLCFCAQSAMADGIHFIHTFSNKNKLMYSIDTKSDSGTLTFQDIENLEGVAKSGIVHQLPNAFTIPSAPALESNKGTIALPSFYNTANIESDESIKAFEDFQSESIFLHMEHRFFIVTKNGKFITLPVDYKHVDTEKAKLSNNVVSFSHKGKSYLLVKIKLAGATKEYHPNEVFLIRQDGKFIKIGEDANTKITSYSVDNGILSVLGHPRKIDLDCFDVEARFIPKKAETIKDQEKEITAEKKVNEFSQNLSDDLNLQKRAVPFSKEEYYPLRKAMFKKTVGSFVVVGPAGTGKTTLLESFVVEIFKGSFPEIPRTISILHIDPASLGAGTQLVGTFEARVKALIEYAKERPTLVIMDEIHSLRGQGTHMGNSNDFFQIIKPYLANGQLRIAGTSTEAEFNQSFSGDQALFQRFEKIKKEPLNDDGIINAMKTFIEMAEYFMPDEDTLREIIRLSNEFNAIDAQPRKGLRLLEATYAMLMIEDRLHEAPTVADARRAASQFYHVNEAFFDFDSKVKLLSSFREGLDEDVSGQSLAKDEFEKYVHQIYMGTAEPDKPFALLFTGTSGTGKTLLAITIAKRLGLPYKVLDMTRYALPGMTNVLHREIAQSLRENAMTVFIIDEIEKASPFNQEALLKILDDGRFTVEEFLDTNGRSTSFLELSASKALFIFTSNAGQDILKRRESFGFLNVSNSESSLESLSPELLKDNQTKIKAEEDLKAAVISDNVSEFLVKRLNGIIPFNHLSLEEFKAGLELHLDKLIREQSSKHKTNFEITEEEKDAVIQFITTNYYNETTSMREAVIKLQKLVRTWLAEVLKSKATSSTVKHSVQAHFYNVMRGLQAATTIKNTSSTEKSVNICDFLLL